MLQATTLLNSRMLMIGACAAASLALTGCGHSDKAGDPASADNVEMPAEETMSGLAASAIPQADPSAAATDQPAGADASASAADSAAGASSNPAPSAPTSPAAPIKM